MQYRGQNIDIDTDKLCVLKENNEFVIGYYGAGSIFVTIDKTESFEEADAIFDLLYDGLLQEEEFERKVFASE